MAPLRIKLRVELRNERLIKEQVLEPRVEVKLGEVAVVAKPREEARAERVRNRAVGTAATREGTRPRKTLDREEGFGYGCEGSGMMQTN